MLTTTVRVVRAAALTLGMVVAAMPLRAETLADALIAAYRNSNLLEQNRAVLRAADEDVAVALSALRPVLSLGADASYSNQRFIDTTASVASGPTVQSGYPVGNGSARILPRARSSTSHAGCRVQIRTTMPRERLRTLPGIPISA